MEGKTLAFIIILTSTIHAEDVDPCKRQPFRGRCPPSSSGLQIRSQFVLRYYLRDGECVSYPFGHCADDESEPILYRYKEECEDACLLNAALQKIDGVGQTTKTYDQTYATFLRKEITGTESSTLSYVDQPLTECLKRRTNVESAFISGGFIPICNSDGSFRSLQCERNGQQCFCVDQNGIEIPNSRTTNAKIPDCNRIAEAQKPTIYDCSVKFDEGPCSSSVARWYYDENEQSCREFRYSGCGGNGNNYATKGACEKRCLPAVGSAKCHGGVEPLKTAHGIILNCQKSPCPTGYKCSIIQKISVCCPYTEKIKEAGVLHSGLDPDICNLPKERGPCDHYELRFYYNSALKECKYFFFGGCEGNANNFERVEFCENSCGRNAHKNDVKKSKGVVVAGQTTKNTLSFSPSTVSETEKTPETVPTEPQKTEFFFEAISKTAPTEVNEAQIPTTTQKTFPEAEEEAENQSDTELPRNTHTEIFSTSSNEASVTSSEITETDADLRTTLEREKEFDNNPTRNQERITTSGPKSSEHLSMEEPREQLHQSTSTVTIQSTIQSISNTTKAEVIHHAPQPLPPTFPDNRCLHARDSGLCSGEFFRWYWNAERKICQIFTYTGCGGNGNNFATREECLLNCHREAAITVKASELTNICEHKIDAGNCNGDFKRYAFDPLSHDCKAFRYGGCGGNGNNFANLAECRGRCKNKSIDLPLNVCKHPIEVGDCSGTFIRFAYDPSSNECRQFTYGGCGGNGNNFATHSECRMSCVQVDCKQKPVQCDLNRCQLVNDFHGCPFCSCPPVNLPLPPGHAKMPSLDCPQIDVLKCVEPCIVFSNRKGCQECICPTIAPKSSKPIDISLNPSPIAGPLGPSVQLQHVPQQFTKMPAPPSSATPSPPAPPAPPAHSENHRSQQGATLVQLKPVASEKLRSFAENVQSNQQQENGHYQFLNFNEKCLEEMDAGPCKKNITRWYFNSRSEKCESFVYGGCAGNRNHFFSMKECEIHCARFASFATNHVMSTGTTHAFAPILLTSQWATDDAVRVAASKSTPPSFTKLIKNIPKGNTSSIETHKIYFSAPDNVLKKKHELVSQNAAAKARTVPLVSSRTALQHLNASDIPLHSTTPLVIKPVTTNTIGKYPNVAKSSSASFDHTQISSKNNEILESDEEKSGSLNDKSISSEYEAEYMFAFSTHSSIFSIDSINGNVGEPVTVKHVDSKISYGEELAINTTIATLHTVSFDNKSSTTLFEGISKEGKVNVEDVMHQESKNIQFTSPAHTIFDDGERLLSSNLTKQLNEETFTFSDISRSNTSNVTQYKITATTGTASATERQTTLASSSYQNLVPQKITIKPLRPDPTLMEKIITPSDRQRLVKTSKYPSETAHQLQKNEVIPQQNLESHLPTVGNNKVEINTAINYKGTNVTETLPTFPPTAMGSTSFERKMNVKSKNRSGIDLIMVDSSRMVDSTKIEDITAPQASVDENVKSKESTILKEINSVSSESSTNKKHGKSFLPSQQLETQAEPKLVKSDKIIDKLETIDRKSKSTKSLTIGGDKILNSCLQLPDAGQCFDYVPRWFYNSQTHKCEQFSYGSCGGNSNNFLDRQSCETQCQTGNQIASRFPLQCIEEKDEGNGGGYNVKWYFNVRNLRCEQMVYQGSGGNSNKFSTLGECQTFCTFIDESKISDGTSLLKPELLGKETLVIDDQEESKEFVQPDERSARGKSVLPDSDLLKDNLDLINAKIEKSAIPHSREEEILERPEQPDSVSDTITSRKQFVASASSGAASLSTNNKNMPNYNTEPLKEEAKMSAEMPLLGPSPPMEINYQNGSRLKEVKAAGAKFHEIIQQSLVDIKGSEQVDLDPPIVSEGLVSQVPPCPNNLKPMLYTNGKPVMCLPGKNQCPAKSVCYFNGLDFFCCPNEDDPYDTHVFGGYGGDEARHGYKASKFALSVHKLSEEKKRARRDVPVGTLNPDVQPVRFDSNLMNRYIPAIPAKLIRKLNICLQETDSGSCDEAHLRYYYDKRADACRLFYYSGCEGNGNNFATRSECEEKCKTGIEKPLETPTGLCPDGQLPLGDNAPVLCGNLTDSIACPPGFYCNIGPPDVCCSLENSPNLKEFLANKKKSKNVRFSPNIKTATHLDHDTTEHHHHHHEHKALTEETQEVDVASDIRKTDSVQQQSPLNIPLYMCPDGSDPLTDESGALMNCGIDSNKGPFCPVGFYCSMDSGKVNLCCPMEMLGSKIAPPLVDAPYFGIRKPNPGEVIERGSLPSDPIPPKLYSNKSELVNDDKSKQSTEKIANDDVDSGRAEQVDAATEASYGRMMLKPVGKNLKTLAYYDINQTAKHMNDDGVHIDIGEPDDPFEDSSRPQIKASTDRSICHLKPTEGRLCRENEVGPRTNLQYFYSRRDRRCKLFFYRGCGGNLNRFETKRQCELLCMEL